MSKSYPFNAIPTEYKGIMFRSRLESNVAYFFDLIGVKWEFEPKSFLLSIGKHYYPDFYLPELKTWVEVKGVLSKEHVELYEKFSEESEKEMLIIEPMKMTFASNPNCYLEAEGLSFETVVIGHCSKCKRVFFCDLYCSYHCRACGEHNGDHDIKFIFYEGDIDFTDPSGIKRFVEELGILRKKEE